MSKIIVSEGKTTSEAIEKGLKELNLHRDQVEIRVLEQEKRSFLTKNRAINQKFCNISAKCFFDSFNRRKANNNFS